MDLTNYVDVPERFRQALQRWPELRVMENRPEIITIGDKTFISVTMQIWRTPDDPIPAQATCFEPFPGKNPVLPVIVNKRHVSRYNLCLHY